MKLCSLRHGEAVWPNWDKPDDERPLTERGRNEMKRVAKFLERLNFSADAILTSPLPRASQTAEIVAKRLGIELKTDSALAHGFNVERLRRLLGKADADCVMVVGHEPAFSDVTKELSGGVVNVDVRADVDGMIEREDAARTPVNATEARSSASAAFFRCAMSVNATIWRGQVLSFHSAQPNHARDNGVAIRCIDGDNFASVRAIFYHCACEWLVSTFPRKQ